MEGYDGDFEKFVKEYMKIDYENNTSVIDLQAVLYLSKTM